MMAAMFQMMDGSYSSHDPLFSSSVRHLKSSSDWTMPTPPVSPSHEDDHFVDVNRLSEQHSESSSSSSGLGSPSSASSSDDDLDLGLGDILGGLGDFAGCWDNNEWLFEDLYGQTQPMGSLAVNSCSTTDGGSCDVMRHDCMWAGHCPAEEHRIKKEQPSMLMLSSSPTESAISMLNAHHHQTSSTAVVTRTRLDTLGSIRPETPLSLSDSELETDQLTADECSNTNRRIKDKHFTGSCTSSSSSSSSSSGDESEDDEEEEDEPMMKKMKPTLPPNIHPVRNSHHVRKLINAKASIVPTLPDHSYSHSDHSYHTQRRPAPASVASKTTFLDANAGTTTAALLGIQTPSDSEEEIDVVSLGEVLRMNPAAVAAVRSSVAAASIPAAMVAAAVSSSSSSKMPSIGFVASSSVNSQQHSTSHQNAPIRLKLKVAPVSASTSSGSVMQRKALPSQPSALVRQQLQLAVATAAAQQQQHRKQPAIKKEAGARSISGKKSRSMAAAASTDSSDSSSCSPRKSQQQLKAQQSHRSSRAGSDSEDSCEKRSQHNSMERQRRVDLRNAFEFLRSLIPDLETTDRAAKVVILKKAANFCQGLTQREKQYMVEKDALQKRNEMLRKRISLLQRRR